MSSPPTVAYFRDANGLTQIEFHCHGCARVAVLTFAQARARDDDTVLTLARGRVCSACGGRSVTVRPHWVRPGPAR